MLSEYHVTGEDPHLGMDKDSGGDQNDGDSEDDYTPDKIDTMIQNVDTFNEVEQFNKEAVLIAVTNIMSSKNKSVSCSVTTITHGNPALLPVSPLIRNHTHQYPNHITAMSIFL